MIAFYTRGSRIAAPLAFASAVAAFAPSAWADDAPRTAASALAALVPPVLVPPVLVPPVLVPPVLVPPVLIPAKDTQPLDVREPPFGFGDFSWMNGTNRQPDSLLKVGPLTLSVLVDAYYLWSFAQPLDHTAFPTTTAPRHNEVSVNMASIGVELAPGAIDSKGGGPIGQFSLQYGTYTEALVGQDPTLARGSYLTKVSYLPVRTASAGWHFHALHGINLEAGLFLSYIALESYLPQENWNYLHPFASDFTPYYFAGVRAQVFPTARTKVELWVVNGWQTLGQWHEGRAFGYLGNLRPTERVSLTHSFYIGQDAQGDDKSLRVYSDNYVQWQYYKKPSGNVQSMAVCLVGDLGYEKRGDGAREGVLAAASVSHRVAFKHNFALAFRGDLFFDESQAVVANFPVGNPYLRPDRDRAFLGGGFATTIDYSPSPWLLTRLEFMHRLTNIPYFSGPGGITGPGGLAPTAATQSSFTPDLRRSDNRIVANVTLRL